MHWQAATSTLLRTYLTRSRRGLIADVDGTLSHIVDHPAEAAVTPRSRTLLDALHTHLTLVAVLSGRSAADTRAMVGVPEIQVVGNHGLEWWRNGRPSISPEVAAYRSGLEHALDVLRQHPLPGVLVEDKGATVTVHYRLTENPAAARKIIAALLEKIAQQADLHIFPGRMIFEIRPPLEINKGTALGELIRQHRLNTAIYIGDDVTDVDALRAARHLREQGECFAIGVGVESPHMPAGVRDTADLLVAGVQDVEAFLAWLLSAVTASDT